MISRKEHLKQINRFHDLVEKIDKQIEETKDEKERLHLLVKYFNLTSKVWPFVDDKICDIKDKLDEFENKY